MVKRMLVNTFLSSIVFTILFLIYCLILVGLENSGDSFSFVIVFVISLLLYLVLGVPLTFFTYWIYRGINWTILKHFLIQATLLIFASMIVYVFFLRGIEIENMDIRGALLISYLTVIAAQIGYLFANRKLS